MTKKLKKAFTFAGGQNPLLNPDFRKRAFTLAEMLITLTIIGIVAALTIPSLMSEIDNRINSERQVNIVQKVTKAMEMMKVEGRLGSFDTTDEFVDELQKYLKIVKRCDSEHLTECWPTKKVRNSANVSVNVANVKNGAQLGFEGREGINNVGIVLSDGAALIMTYDPQAYGYGTFAATESIPVSLPVGNKTQTYEGYTTSVTSGLAFVMDVNGASKPNKETIAGEYHDIRSFNGAHFGSPASTSGCSGVVVLNKCVVQISSYEPVLCIKSEDNPECVVTVDYWQGAKNACTTIGMSLTHYDSLKAIYMSGTPGLPDTGLFWSSINYGGDCAWAVDFSSGAVKHGVHRIYQHGVLCVGN